MNDHEKPGGTTPEIPEPTSGHGATAPLGDRVFGAPSPEASPHLVEMPETPESSPETPTEQFPAQPLASGEPTSPTQPLLTKNSTDSTEPVLSIGTPAPAEGPLAKAVPHRAPAPGAPAPGAPYVTTPDPDPVSRAPRVGTVVWGFIIIALGTAVLAVSLGADVDFALVAIGVLGLAGLTLVIGSVVAASRRRGA